jgi:hypothetical protein
MGKKMKLNLNQLKVKSFVTSLSKDLQDRVNGGGPTWGSECQSDDDCTPYSMPLCSESLLKECETSERCGTEEICTASATGCESDCICQ